MDNSARNEICLYCERIGKRVEAIVRLTSNDEQYTSRSESCIPGKTATILAQSALHFSDRARALVKMEAVET